MKSNPKAAKTIFAGVRNLEAQTAKEIAQLGEGPESKFIFFQLDSVSDADHQAITSLVASHNINHLDIVIANAGVGPRLVPTQEAPISDFLDYFITNTLRPEN